MFAAAAVLRSVASRVVVGGTVTTKAPAVIATAAVRAATTLPKPEAGTETGIASGPAAAQVRGGAGSAATPAAAAAADPLSELVFEFDLNGWVVVRNVLTPEEVAAANDAIDAHSAELHERTDPALRNTKAGSALSGDGSTGRMDMAGMLGWPKPHCEPFRNMLAHPKLIPLLHRLVGQGYRMDHLPFLIAQNKGAEGFSLHGGPLTGDGQFNTHLQYRCEQGQIFNSLLAMSVVLTEHKPGDGGFCVVRGSHKMKFPVPDQMMNGEAMTEHIYQPVTNPGDVVFFSEATVHGCLPWNAEHQRRVVLYRFAPSNCAYGRTYHPAWPDNITDGCTPQQLAVLQPPYNNRLDRPFIGDDGDIHYQSRSSIKKKFDADVFQTKYF